ncbi:asparaginase [Candidatus Parcubacteria bacterium]|nr:MAG: asparaginase [Candidatus Parcubacteria bacterium]
MPKNDDKIHFITTGGTIDSYYDGTRDTVVPYKESIIPEYLMNLELYAETIFSETTVERNFSELMMKDSREITKGDMQRILDVTEASEYKKIIITQGTYTIPDTARFLKANLTKSEKVVILMGSFIPLKGFTPSDAPFNIGYAIAKMEHLKPGVYVCMNGRTFLPKDIAKSISEGKYISIQKEN